MKILFKNTTKYDKENCNNFVMFHNNKYGTKKLIKAILAAICIIYMLIFNIISKNWRFLITLAFVLSALCLIVKYKAEKEKEKKKKKKIKEFTFYFYEKYIKIKYRRQFERMRYFEVKKIFETDENFFLYTDESHSLILDKEGFIIGNSENFPEFIKKKCPFKYRNETNK